MSSSEQNATQRILTVTLNPTVDTCMEVPRLSSGGKNRAKPQSVQGGGGGINVARCLRRLGGSATAWHTSGREVGARLNRLLDAEGLDHRSTEIGSDTREAIIVAEHWTGHSYHIVPPGPVLTDDEEKLCMDAIVAAAHDVSYLIITGSVTHGLRDDFCAEIVRRTGTNGTKVILDIAAEQLPKALQEDIFMVRLDRHEAAELIGQPIEDFGDARAANDYLLANGAIHNALTTVGALGAVYSDRVAHYEISAPISPHPPRSDVCAGDSLVASVTFQLSRGHTCLHACEFGVAAAAATVRLPGTEVFEFSTVETLRSEVITRKIIRR